MDRFDDSLHSRARHLRAPVTGGRGAAWMDEAMRHLFDAATATKRR
jgi:hypothetical protein